MELTEAIPSDWSLETISEFCGDEQLIVDGPFGSNLKNEHYVHSGIPVLTGGNITGNIWNFQNIRFISRAKAQELFRCNARVGDLLTIKIGSVGFTAAITSLGNYDFAIIPANLLRIRVENEDSLTDYLKYFLQSDKTVQILKELGTSTAQPALNLRKFRALNVAKPTYMEQKAIAEALSDIDELIENTRNLINKIANTKTSVCRPLVLGEKRLNGFTVGWEEKTLGDLLQYEQPTKYLVNTTQHLEAGLVPVLTAGKTFLLGYTNETHGVYNAIPAILFDDFTTAHKYVDFPFKVKSSACKMLTTTNPHDSLRFLSELMSNIEFLPYDHKRYWISEYSKIKVLIPNGDEQEAIAKVVADFDSQIETLTIELQKYQWLKQGMMNDLLTGRVRLV